jgi:hypothetical protein
MLPLEIETHIFEYLGIKPGKRCKATTLKGKICKKTCGNKETYPEFLCEKHKKKANKIYNTTNLKDEILARFLLMHGTCKTKEDSLKRKKKSIEIARAQRQIRLNRLLQNNLTGAQNLRNIQFYYEQVTTNHIIS